MEVVFRPRTFREPWNHHVPFNSSTDCISYPQEHLYVKIKKSNHIMFLKSFKTIC